MFCRTYVDDMLGEKIAASEINFYVTDPETGNRRIRTAETNLGDFVADGRRYQRDIPYHAHY